MKTPIHENNQKYYGYIKNTRFNDPNNTNIIKISDVGYCKEGNNYIINQTDKYINGRSGKIKLIVEIGDNINGNEKNISLNWLNIQSLSAKIIIELVQPITRIKVDDIFDFEYKNQLLSVKCVNHDNWTHKHKCIITIL